MGMRREEIKKWIQLVEESDIAELEICEGRNKIRISKGAASTAMPVVASSPLPTQVPVSPTEANTAAEEKLASNLKEITSPMVGTFYSAPAPDADTFVNVGQAVSVGQTVCIVEAMKLMNEIGSDFSGKIREILVENGEPVEYGQPLFRVEAA